MGAVALQRVVVRMLHDPVFNARVHAEPATALAGLDITDEERGWIANTDHRAFALDPYRRSRALTGLIEEFAVSCALVLRGRGGVPALEAFFGSVGFHTGMQVGESLAALFGGYLRTLHPQVSGIADLESAIARCRRRASGVGTGWRLAPGVALVEVPSGTLKFHTEARDRLQKASPDLADAVVGSGRLPDPPEPVGTEAWLLRAETNGSVDLERLPPELLRILAPAATGCTREELEAAAQREGAEPGETATILEDFVAYGELIAGEPA